MKKSLYKKVTLFFLLIIFCFGIKAQTYVTIPDASFAAWLNANYPSCMNGNQMDITCSGITGEDSVNLDDGTTIGYITNLTGIENFTALTYFDFSNNGVSSLPTLPLTLTYLNCGFNWLSSLPNLPPNLIKLYCYGNGLNSLPALPVNLEVLNCAKNPLAGLPNLPTTLKYLYCYECQLTNLPPLSPSLIGIQCYDNQLVNLPNLPSGLGSLSCSLNLLTGLPALPNLSYLICNNNNIACFPKFPGTLSGMYPNQLSISGNPFSCLPNYVGAMDAATLAYPLCIDGDPVNNPNACPGADGITGYTFFDNNSNCIRDLGDSGLIHVPIRLFDSNNTFLKKTYSLSNSIYHLLATAGNYTVEIDTAGMPFTIQCPSPGIDSTVTLTVSNPLVQDVNFEIACKPGFDVGTQAVVASGWVFPGQQHSLQIIAGDLSKWYNLICAGTDGLSGQVEVAVTGPVTYIGITSGALTPSASGNVFTYSIADYSIVNILNDFGLIFQTNNSAQSGDFICVNVTVTPSAGDNNTSNNNYQFCYLVVNSYDPNMKEVSPVNVLPGFNDYFTYTIHFQNTGNAPAINILLTDTLDSNLDLETFQVASFSHYNSVSLDSNIIRFRFNNIMLPDSASDATGSIGFVQYRIKPKANLPLGTTLENTAYIYFDYNTPVITNTTVNEYVQTISISENATACKIGIFPNPGSGKFKFSGIPYPLSGVEIFNILGERIFQSETLPAGRQVSNPPERFRAGLKSEIDISSQPKGIYFLQVSDGKNVFETKKIIIE